MEKIQVARLIFLNSLSTMKKLLDLMAFKLDKRTADYKYIKSQIMDFTYNNLLKLFKSLTDENIITKCECGHSLRKGYSSCPKCSGSGFRNKEK